MSVEASWPTTAPPGAHRPPEHRCSPHPASSPASTPNVQPRQRPPNQSSTRTLESPHSFSSSEATGSHTTSLPSYSSRGYNLHGFQPRLQRLSDTTTTSSSTSTFDSVSTSSMGNAVVAYRATSRVLQMPAQPVTRLNPCIPPFVPGQGAIADPRMIRGGTRLDYTPTMPTSSTPRPDLQAMRMLNWYAFHTGQPDMPSAYPLARASALEREQECYHNREAARQAELKCVILNRAASGTQLNNSNDDQPPTQDQNLLPTKAPPRIGYQVHFTELHYPRPLSFSRNNTIDDLERKLTALHENGGNDGDDGSDSDLDFLDIFRLFDPTTRDQVKEKKGVPESTESNEQGTQRDHEPVPPSFVASREIATERREDEETAEDKDTMAPVSTAAPSPAVTEDESPAPVQLTLLRSSTAMSPPRAFRPLPPIPFPPLPPRPRSHSGTRTALSSPSPTVLQSTHLHASPIPGELTLPVSPAPVPIIRPLPMIPQSPIMWSPAEMHSPLTPPLTAFAPAFEHDLDLTLQTFPLTPRVVSAPPTRKVSREQSSPLSFNTV